MPAPSLGGAGGRGRRRLAGFGLSLVAAVALAGATLALAGGSTPTATSPTAHHRLRHVPAADLAYVAKAEASIHALEAAPGMPTCAPPPIPAATYPPGNSYGVPFLAAVTNGQILSGYDEWSANHTTWVVKGHTYKLYPWQTKVFGITGWVAGLLQLPSLSATIPASGVVFCDGGGNQCESANPPAGQCIWVDLTGAPVSGSPPSPSDTNKPPPHHQCYQAHNFCIPYVISLTPVGNTTLTVMGVDQNGALNLSVTTSAKANLSITLPTTSETCSDDPTSITLSTQVPSGLPAGAPIPPKPPNPDLRGLQTLPAPLTGPLGTATSTVASNDFYVPAFSPTACPLLAAVFDAPLAGWNAKSSSDPASQNNNYYDKNPLPADAGTPGWVQFTSTTTVSSLGIPVGPPTGF